jgi:hypothetical protein
MAKPYDSTTKELLEGYPVTWLAYVGFTPGGPVTVVDADLSTFTAEADKVYRVDEPTPYLVHLEIQASADRTVSRRMLRYHVLLDVRHNLRVRSALILLRPEADHKELTGVLELRHANGERAVEFRYTVVRAWEQPLERLLGGGLGTLPVAPLAAVPRDEVAAVVETIDKRLVNETAPETAATIMEATLILAGLRLQEEQVQELRGKLRSMNITTESSYYRLAVKEGMKEGIKEGGREEARKLLLRVAETRLGPPDEKSRSTIDGIQELEELERLVDRALVVRTWQELLAQKRGARRLPLKKRKPEA